MGHDARLDILRGDCTAGYRLDNLDFRLLVLLAMSLLDAEIQTLFGDVFGALYLNGNITRVTFTDDGMGGLTENLETSPCKVQRDVCTEAQRLEEGYSTSDVRLLILQKDQEPIDANCRVMVLETLYQLGPNITQDPARSYWECRGVKF